MLGASAEGDAGESDKSGMTWKERITDSFVDQYLPIEYAVERMTSLMGIKPGTAEYDDVNTYAKAHINFGVGHAQMEELQLRHFEPMKDAMVRHGVTNEQFGEYLLARAAPGRNRHIAKKMRRGLAAASDASRPEWEALVARFKDERGNDNGSGMTEKVAIDTVKRMESDPQFVEFLKDSFNPLGNFYEMHQNDLALRVKAGLIGESEQKAMTKAASEFSWAGTSAFAQKGYAYAPMVGFEGETNTVLEQEEILEVIMGGLGVGSGKGFTQPTAKHLSKAAMGRKGTADPRLVLPQSFQQVSEGMIRSQRNSVAQSFGHLHDMMREIKLNGVNLEGEKVSEDMRKLVVQEYDSLFEDLYDKDGNIQDERQVSYDTSVDVAELSENPALPLKITTLTPEFSTNPRVFAYRHEGEVIYVKFRDNAKATNLAASLRNMRYKTLGSPISKGFNAVTKWISRVVTTWNVSFVTANFVRDYLSAAINLNEDDKAVFAKDALNPKNILHAMKGIWKAERAKSKGRLPQVDNMALRDMDPTEAAKDPVTAYLFAKAHGAKVGMFRHDTVGEHLKRLDDDLGKRKFDVKSAVDKGPLKYMANLVEDTNAMVENSIRISTFWAAINAGRSTQEAADASRNATVDFNVGGSLKQGMNAYFMFFGASMASMRRMKKTLDRRGGPMSPKALKLYAKLIGASVFFNVLSRALTADDAEEGEEPYLDRVTPHLRDTNATLTIPGFMTSDEKPRTLTSPVALGWSWFWALGQNISDLAFNVMSDGKEGSGPLEAGMRMWNATETAFNPIGGSGSLWTMATPTALKPMMEIATNRNFMDQQIVREDGKYDLPSPAYTRDPEKTPKALTNLSEAMNRMMGGDEVTPGDWLGNPLGRDSELTRFDLSGSEMGHLLGYLGGLKDFGMMFFEGGQAIFDEASGFRPEKVVGLRRFYRGTAADFGTVHRFYDLRERVKGAEAKIENAEDATERAAAKRDFGNLIKLGPTIKKIDNYLGNYRRLKKKAGSLTGKEKKQQLDKLEESRIKHMLKALAAAHGLGINA